MNGISAALLERGAQPATARSRQLARRRFSTWLLEEGEISDDPLVGLKAAKLDSRIVQPLTETQLRALIDACKGREMRDRRDEAIIRFMVETGARAGEVVALLKPDVDLREGVAHVRRGKGGKGRTVPYGPQTTRALDRYLRVRSTHRLADSPGFWLGDRGKAFGYDALHKSLALRAERAGINGFHPHLLRHTAAHRWLAAGGSETGLMAVAGWTCPDLLLRPIACQTPSRAVALIRCCINEIFGSDSERQRCPAACYRPGTREARAWNGGGAGTDPL